MKPTANEKHPPRTQERPGNPKTKGKQNRPLLNSNNQKNYKEKITRVMSFQSTREETKAINTHINHSEYNNFLRGDKKLF